MSRGEPRDRERRDMVEQQLEARGIRDARVLDAMLAVPRELFVPPAYAGSAYDDDPLPIGGGQTISQPFVVAFMIEALRLEGAARVLEVGTGSGYAAAVLARVAGEVWTIERDGRLAAEARGRLRELGAANVRVVEGDGTLGYPPAAPYEGIVVAASGPRVPESLTEQLAEGGTLVIPVGSRSGGQELTKVRRGAGGHLARESLGPVQFVSLRGEEGWS